MVEMTIFRLELPPWKTFLKERQAVLTRFDRAVEKAHEGAKQRIDVAERDALAALESRAQRATGG